MADADGRMAHRRCRSKQRTQPKPHPVSVCLSCLQRLQGRAAAAGARTRTRGRAAERIYHLRERSELLTRRLCLHLELHRHGLELLRYLGELDAAVSRSPLRSALPDRAAWG